MLDTAKLLDLFSSACEKRYGKGTQYRMARTLGVTDAALLRWRRGGVPDDENAYKISVFLGLDPINVILWLQAERCKGKPTAPVWEALAEYHDTRKETVTAQLAALDAA